MTQKLMQYDPERDDKVLKLSVDSPLMNNPIVRKLYGTDKSVSVEYLQTLKSEGRKDVVISRTTDCSKGDEIALYNTLRAMEIKNPSSSRIREEFKLNARDVGLLVGRYFETNQPVFYETMALRSDQRFKDHLDKKLGEELPESRYGPILRATWLGSHELLGRDYMDTSAGRLVGVVPESR